jgi:hypothetical protein
MKFTHILVLALAVFFAACGGKGKKDGQDSNKKDSAAAKTETPAAKSPKDLIAKKWNIDIEMFKALVKEEMAKDKNQDPAAAKMAEAMIEPMIKAMGDMSFEFMADGKMKITVQGKTEEGKWSLSEDGKKLMTEGGKDNKKDEMDIIELTEGKLVISSAKDKMKIAFTPAK